MFRLKLILIVVGGVVGYFGLQEFRVSFGTSSEAAEVDLAAVENGTAPENNHIQIGEHLALYAASIYEYEQSKYDSSAPGSTTKVTHAYFPVISLGNAASEENEGLDFAVLVKTKKYKTIGAIPDGIVQEASIKGLVINQIDSLDNEEKGLLKQNFPTINLDTVLILEQDRKPASLLKSVGMILGGLALAAGGIGLFFVRSKG